MEFAWLIFILGWCFSIMLISCVYNLFFNGHPSEWLQPGGHGIVIVFNISFNLTR